MLVVAAVVCSNTTREKAVVDEKTAEEVVVGSFKFIKLNKEEVKRNRK